MFDSVHDSVLSEVELLPQEVASGESEDRIAYLTTVDELSSGWEPDERQELPDLSTINLHSFRWDHALAFAHWLLKDEYPDDVVVYLIEAESLEFGEPLSATVSAAMDRLVDRLVEELAGEFAPSAGGQDRTAG